MISIRLDFIAGRYHSTPWDRQVNEGSYEWPPSPWRLIRALIATRHLKAPEVKEESLRRIIDALGGEPCYRLPNVTVGHSVHYMPVRSGSGDKRSKVYDTFLCTNGRPVHMIWSDASLDDDLRDDLRKLLSLMGYFGRAESWANLSLEESRIEPNVVPRYTSDGVGDMELVEVLMPMGADEYLSWRTGFIDGRGEIESERVVRDFERRGKSPTKRRMSKVLEDLESRVPTDIYRALCMETSSLKDDAWSSPPGVKWVPYLLPRDSVSTRIFPWTGAVASRPRSGELPTLARYSLSSPVLPNFVDSISVADRLHKTLVSISDGMPVFSGRDGSGEPMAGHRHAHIICEPQGISSNGARTSISFIDVYAPMGLGVDATDVLGRVRRLWGHGGHDIHLALIGIGDPEDYGGMDTMRGDSPIMATSDTWVSSTPFIPTRVPKATRAGVPKIDETNGLQIGSPEHDALRLIGAAGLPTPTRIERLGSIEVSGKPLRPYDFRQDRPGAGRTHRGGVALRIEFEHPVQGPISMGRFSHFGMGSFKPPKGS